MMTKNIPQPFNDVLVEEVISSDFIDKLLAVTRLLLQQNEDEETKKDD